MARQFILILGSLCGGGLALSLLAHQLSQPEQVISPQSHQISAPVVSDERPWPPIPTPPPPLPSPQPRPSGSLPIPVPIPRTEGVSRFENGRITNPALYQATVDAFVDHIKGYGFDPLGQGILVMLPDGTELASFQPHQHFSSSVVSRLATSQAALQTWGSPLEALSLLPLLQEMHLRADHPSQISDQILTGLNTALAHQQGSQSSLTQPLATALAEISQVQPQMTLPLVASPDSLMGILQSLALEGQLSTLLPAQISNLPQMVMEQGSAQSLSVGQGESYVMAGQLPDGTLFVLVNRGSSVEQVQHLQHRLLLNLATLRQ